MVHEAWIAAKTGRLDNCQYQEKLALSVTSYKGVANEIAIIILQEVKMNLKLIHKS